MSKEVKIININKKKGNFNIIYKNKLNLDKSEKSELKISELKKELIDIKKNELSLYEKESKEQISEEQKQKNVEQIIKKWLNLQKTIKEEITLEDVIMKQQENDRENLKSFFRKFYDLKINKRRKLEDIKELKLESKESNIPLYIIEKDVENNLRATCEPIKNLLFILRNNYDYLMRLISLIKPEDYTKNQKILIH